MNDKLIEKICYGIPKAELHLHIEGSLSAAHAFAIAKRNNRKIPFESIEQMRIKFNFKDKNEFLDFYFSIISVLETELDFEELIYNYLMRASKENVKYAEIFFDPQYQLARGVSFETIINGYINGMKKSKKEFGIEPKLIISYLRTLSEESALELLEEAKPYIGEYIIAMGLDSDEFNNPPDKFLDLFKKSREFGLKLCAHAEEGPLTNIKSLIDDIKIDRIDHGFNIIQDKNLILKCAQSNIPLTICPISNHALGYKSILSDGDFIKTIFTNNLIISLNSDDPEFFGDSYIGKNYYETFLKANLNLEQLCTLAKNSFISSFLDKQSKQNYLNLIDEYLTKINSDLFDN